MLHFVNAGVAGAVLSFALVAGSAASVQARESVSFNGRAEPGTIVIKTSERRLYFVLGDGKALRYKVAVGKPGKQWAGASVVNGKFVNPAWTPPGPACDDAVRRGIRDSRDESPGVDRHLRVLRLHPHAQP